MKSIAIAFTVLVTTAAVTFGCSSSTSGTGTEEKGTDGGGGAGKDSGGGNNSGGSGMTKVICSVPKAETPMCTISSVPSSEAALQEKDCSTTGSNPGTVVQACPTAGLSGCCTLPENEICYYSGGASDNGCTAPGTWSTKP